MKKKWLGALSMYVLWKSREGRKNWRWMLYTICRKKSYGEVFDLFIVKVIILLLLNMKKWTMLR